MFEENNFYRQHWSLLNNMDLLLEPITPPSDLDSPLWSPTTSNCTSFPSSEASSPGNWSQGKYFSFKETEMEMIPQQGIEMSHLSSQELWNAIEWHDQRRYHFHQEQNDEFQDDAGDDKKYGSNGEIDRSCENPENLKFAQSLNEEVSRTSQEGEELGFLSSHPSSSESEDDNSVWDANEGFSQENYLKDIRCMWIDCKAAFDNQNALIRHIDRSHVEGRKEDFRCFWLGCPRKSRPFNARYKLLIHMRVHTGHKPNRCNVQGCGKAFSRLENLKIHVRSHTGERPYVCHQCTKAFSNSSDRAKHQRTHIESKPYRCIFPTCDKKYTDPSSLRKHAKIHSTIPLNSPLNVKAPKSSQHPQQKSRSIKGSRKENNQRSKNPHENAQFPCKTELPTFSSIKGNLERKMEIDMSFEIMAFSDTTLDALLEPKCETLLSDIEWMASGELKDIDQILSF